MLNKGKFKKGQSGNPVGRPKKINFNINEETQEFWSRFVALTPETLKHFEENIKKGNREDIHLFMSVITKISKPPKPTIKLSGYKTTAERVEAVFKAYDSNLIDIDQLEKLTRVIKMTSDAITNDVEPLMIEIKEKLNKLEQNRNTGHIQMIKPVSNL